MRKGSIIILNLFSLVKSVLKKSVFTYNLLFLICLLFTNTTTGQVESTSDTLQWTNLNYLHAKDSAFLLNKIKSDQFYDSIISKASKNKITKTAISWLLINNNHQESNFRTENLKNEDYYKIYSGKKIRNIEIVKLDVFGPNINSNDSHTAKWFEKAGNKAHFKTRDFIIRNNLFFKPEDVVDPKLMLDNERFLRELDYMRDASILIAEIQDKPGYVDVMIIVKDVFSLGAYVDLYNTNSGEISIYENNIAGIGHRFEGSLLYNTLYDPFTGYAFNYKINNISGTFIETRINHYKAFETERTGIDINRRFITYQTKWAGGLGIYQVSKLENIRKTDTVLTDVRLNYSTQDIWLGRSFLLRTNNWQYQKSTRLVLSTRYINNTFYKGPEVSERYNFQYHNNQIALISIAFTRQKYYKSNLIYGFGKTEDIPIGMLIQFDAGLEKDEFFKRPYIGLQYSQGNYFPKIGYLNLHTSISGFYYENKTEQGVFRIKTQAISNLHYFKKLKLREFLSINYIRGINRFSDEKVYLNSNDITGFSSDNLYGLQKLAFHSELVAFSDLYIYSFRFLFFGFGDLALIGPENQSIFRQKLYSGLGLGFRVRNENLVFKTFQVKFAFYPTVPADTEQFYYLISGENYTKPANFDPVLPGISDFN